MAPSLFRFLAAILYDFVSIFAVWWLTTLILVICLPEEVDLIDYRPFYLGLLLLATYAFLGFCWTRREGQTLGMLAWGITLKTTSGEVLSWKLASMRFMLALLSTCAMGVGHFWRLLDPLEQTLHDRMVNTRLLRKEKS